MIYEENNKAQKVLEIANKFKKFFFYVFLISGNVFFFNIEQTNMCDDCKKLNHFFQIY